MGIEDPVREQVHNNFVIFLLYGSGSVSGQDDARPVL